VAEITPRHGDQTQPQHQGVPSIEEEGEDHEQQHRTSGIEWQK
jgi:hypothetical protein